MNSTLYGVFFSMLKLSLVHIPFLSSPRIASPISYSKSHLRLHSTARAASVSW
jgi:hypothetical protein